MPVWRLEKITSRATGVLIYHIEKTIGTERKHFQYRRLKITKSGFNLKCTSKNCNSFLVIQIGGAIQTEKKSSGAGYALKETIHREDLLELSNYGDVGHYFEVIKFQYIYL